MLRLERQLTLRLLTGTDPSSERLGLFALCDIAPYCAGSKTTLPNLPKTGAVRQRAGWRALTYYMLTSVMGRTFMGCLCL